jgi:heme exporter protein C
MKTLIGKLYPIIVCAMILISLVLVFFVAPRAQAQAGGDVQRIFYFHVSSLWVGFGAWFITAIYGFKYLRSRDLAHDRVAMSSAEIGLMFMTLGLLSGMLWGRPVWNAWWTWEPKLTLSALQYLTYAAYLMLRMGVDDVRRRARFASVYGIIGALIIPLNFLISRVLQSLHPAVFGPSVNAAQQGGFGIEQTMLWTLIVCLISFTLVYFYFLHQRIYLQNQADRLEERRVTLLANA